MTRTEIFLAVVLMAFATATVVLMARDMRPAPVEGSGPCMCERAVGACYCRFRTSHDAAPAEK